VIGNIAGVLATAWITLMLAGVYSSIRRRSRSRTWGLFGLGNASLALAYLISGIWAPAMAAVAIAAGCAWAPQFLGRPTRAEQDPLDWLNSPYAGRHVCYGCGLTPEVQKPGKWILCSWCNELRAVVEERGGVIATRR
jgi:hypothetical protein